MIRRRSSTRPSLLIARGSLAIALLVAACGTTGPGEPGATATPGGPGGGPGATEPAGPASGALARIVNLHVPAGGEPGPIDVHRKSFALDGDVPAFSVPYGDVSDWFDPVTGQDGNVFLSAYRPGETGNGNSVMSWTETMVAGERLTFVLTTGGNLDADGNRLGQLQTFDHVITGDVPAPTAGNALLLVNTVALENVIPDRDAFYLFIDAGGSGCALAYYDTDGGRGLLGRQLEYLLPPSTTSLAFHRYAADAAGFADCSNDPMLENVPLALTAGERSLLLLYAPRDGEYRTMLLSLEP